MKLSKSILTAIIAGTAVITLSTSCEKERFEDLKNSNDENVNPIPRSEIDNQSNETYEGCPACGLG